MSMPQRIERQPLRHPLVIGDTLPREASEALEYAFRSWLRSCHLHQQHPAALANWISEHQEALQRELMHPLSPAWMASRPRGFDHQHAASIAAEQRLQFFISALQEQPADQYRLVDRLCHAGAALLAQPLAVRTEPVGLCRGTDGISVMFGPADAVPDRLAQLEQAIATATLPPATHATVILAVLLNIHPFADGNGRIARAYWQFMLADQFHCALPTLPLRQLLTISAGGFELSLREAEIFGRWGPFLRYFATLFACLERANSARPAHLLQELV